MCWIARRRIRLDLSKFTSLTMLTLTFFIAGRRLVDSENQFDMSVVANILSTLPHDKDTIGPSSVRSITLTIVLDDRDLAPAVHLCSVCSEQLEQIDNHLVRLPYLQKLKIVGLGRKMFSFAAHDQAALRRALPLLERRKILCL